MLFRSVSQSRYGWVRGVLHRGCNGALGKAENAIACWSGVGGDMDNIINWMRGAQSDLAISQAELNLRMYQNQYQNAALNLERYQRLLAKDMVSKYEVENLELSANNLKAMVEIAQKQIAQAKQKRQEVLNQYQYLKIKAPNESVVIEKHIKAGEMALAGVPTLVLADLS